MDTLIILGLLTPVPLIVWYMAFYLPQKQEMAIDRKLEDAIDMVTYMNSLRDQTNIESVVIWIAHNGNLNEGMASRQIYLSVFQESYEPPFKSIRERAQGVKCRAGDLDIIRVIRQDQSFSSYIDQVEPGFISGILSDYGAYWLHSFPMGIDYRGFYFVTLATSKQETPFTSQKGSYVATLKSGLQKTFRKVNSSFGRRLKRNLFIHF